MIKTMNKNIIKGLAVMVILVISMTILTGCGNNVKLDLEKIRTELASLTSDNFSYESVQVNVNSLDNDEIYAMEAKYNLADYGITEDNLEDYRFNLNPENKDLWVVLKPAEGKTDAVKSEMDAFIEKMKADEDLKVVSKYTNAIKDEVEGYLIYIATTTQNDAILDKIKNSRDQIFGMMQEVTTDTIEATLGIQPSMVEEFLMQTPMMIVHSSTYIIVKPAKGQEENVKAKIEEYMKNLENQWSTYLPDQYEIVKNRLETNIGDYLVYIATKDNNKVLETIKNNEIK